MTEIETSKYKYGDENNVNTKLVVALHRTLQAEEKNVFAHLPSYGLTIPQFGVLEAVYHIGPMNINMIIEKTLSTSGNMTVVIRNLVKMELITKNRDPEDGRAFQICLTDKGREIIGELFPVHLLNLKKAFSNLEIEEKNDLLTLLKKLNRYDPDKE